jgi:hypothetical protein
MEGNYFTVSSEIFWITEFHVNHHQAEFRDFYLLDDCWKTCRKNGQIVVGNTMMLTPTIERLTVLQGSVFTNVEKLYRKSVYNACLKAGDFTL